MNQPVADHFRWQPFPMSHRLPPVAIIHLMRNTDCHRLVVSKDHLSELVSGIEAELKANHPDYVLKIDDFPTLDALYPKLGQEVSEDPFEYLTGANKLVGLDEGGMYLHSSGSTGLPKPIRLTKGSLASYARMREFFRGLSCKVGNLYLK
jgi:acyl-coenzyme A synthetase/AMP-(fatty) acid ligase